MFFLTSEQQAIFDVANTYPFGEDIDVEFEEYLYGNLARYIAVVPQNFQAGIIKQTLFKNEALMDQFEEWCNNTIEQFTTNRNAIFAKRETIVERFNSTAQTIFSQSLHDGEILNAEQQGTKFTLLLNMSGGFTAQSIVQLVFHDVQIEGELDGYYVYDELVETEDGFALRVLSSFGSPYMEWTVYFKDITANYLYRPAVYSELGEIATWEDYVAALNLNDKYYIVQNMNFVEIDLSSLSQTADGIFAGEVLLGGTFEEAREQIYCATYEDPYAHFSEPIPMNELQDAMFDLDQTMRVRAFNTAFALGEEVASIVNEVLRKANVHSEENMYFSIMATHFEKLGCLADDVKKKWIEE
ncbi:DUF4085 family protein [Bacillus ndiopicus]|uniref:DUF4085 family protein n=1 Tax=Bacillus ndiopicus TaxID=1347368 RepID=UPI0005AA671B|nr:DUF4085 family protein [Bacillus ndiopicus]